MSNFINEVVAEIEKIGSYNWIDSCKAGNVYIYGAGSLANTVLGVLKEHDIPVSGILLDSAYYTPGKNLQGIQIVDVSKQVFKQDDLIVMGMSNMMRGLRLGQEKKVKVVYPAGLSFKAEEQLTLDYIRANAEKISSLAEKLSDDKSREVFKAWLVACTTLDTSRIFECCEENPGYFKNDLVAWDKKKSYINFGAYTGDTVEEFKAACSDYDKIVAAEGDAELAQKLREKYKDEPRIEVLEKVFWRNSQKVSFKHLENVCSVGGTVKAAVNEADATTTASFDEYMSKHTELTFDLISINFRGEHNTLAGAAETIKRMRPTLVAKVGSEREMLFDVFDVLLEIGVDYKYYLRFKDNRENELTLYAV